MILCTAFVRKHNTTVLANRWLSTHCNYIFYISIDTKKKYNIITNDTVNGLPHKCAFIDIGTIICPNKFIVLNIVKKIL